MLLAISRISITSTTRKKVLLNKLSKEKNHLEKMMKFYLNTLPILLLVVTYLTNETTGRSITRRGRDVHQYYNEKAIDFDTDTLSSSFSSSSKEVQVAIEDDGSEMFVSSYKEIINLPLKKTHRGYGRKSKHF